MGLFDERVAYKPFEYPEYYTEGWLKQAAWDELINKRGTTWKKLDDADKQNVDNEQALRLMLENTSLIKRPLLEVGGKIYLGFKPELYQNIFAR